MRTRKPLLPILAASLLLAAIAQAGNGAVGFATPAYGIVADGNLKDWPVDSLRYGLDLSYFGNPPRGEDDLDVNFRVAYESGGSTLWVAAEVRDQTHRVEEEGRAWWNDDSCVLYLDKTHSPAGSGPIAYALAGSRKELSGDTGIPWDPVVAAGSWEDGSGAVHREGSRTVYEFAIDVGRELHAGDALGLDLVVIDLDEDEADEDGSYVCWGSGLFKNRNAGRCGAMVLLDAEASLGRLRGEVNWSDLGSSPHPGTLRITSLAQEQLWIDVAVDEELLFSTELPPGEYRIEPTRWVIETDQALLRIADGAVAHGRVEAQAETFAEVLYLDLAPEPDLLEEAGILETFDETSEAVIDAFLAAWMDYYRIPGASVAIVQRGQRVYSKSLGVVNELTEQAVTSESLFEAASVTKLVFAFAVLRLWERGVLDLDRPLYLDLPFPELTHDERHKLLTPRIVLTHRSGLPNWRQGGDGEPILFRFQPGTDYSYSGEAFHYLARVVAKLDGRSIDEILQQEVLDPLGIRGPLLFHDTPALRRHAVRGHRLEGPTRGNLPDRTGVAHSMYSNAEALATFLLGLLQGEGLEAATYSEALRLQTSRPGGEIAPEHAWKKGFGLGFMLMETPFGLVFGHDGNNGDFRSNLEAYRDLDAGFVLFANHSLGGHLSDQLRKLLLVGQNK